MELDDFQQMLDRSSVFLDEAIARLQTAADSVREINPEYAHRISLSVSSALQAKGWTDELWVDTINYGFGLHLGD